MKLLSQVEFFWKQFGEIIECRVLKDRNSRSNKGVAFVQFNLKSQANSGMKLKFQPEQIFSLNVVYAIIQH